MTDVCRKREKEREIEDNGDRIQFLQHLRPHCWF